MGETLPVAGRERAARAAFERCIASGGVAVFPAGTVYGLACDPLDPAAVERLHRLKGRVAGRRTPAGAYRPAAVMFFDRRALAGALPGLGPRVSAALAALLPGPVTLVVPNPEHRFPLACGPDPGRLGVRLAGGPLAGARCAVAQSSANPTGGADPRTVAEIDASILDGADLVLDGGPLPGTPSTVIDLAGFERHGRWRLLREGALSRERIERALERAGR